MVEELIAEGHTIADVEMILVEHFGMKPADAQLMVDTALGGDGDNPITILEPPVTAAYNPAQPRDPGGEGGGQWISTGSTATDEGVTPDAATEAGFSSQEEADAELALRRAWPQYDEMSDEELLSVQARMSQRIHGNSLAGLVGIKEYRQETARGAYTPSPDELEMWDKAEARYAGVNGHVAARRRAAEFARAEAARAEGAATGKLTIGRDELADILGNAGDTYADAHYVGEYNPDLFRTSDLSGKGIRHYVTLPDGRIAHPDEIHESRARGRIIVVPNYPAPRDRARYRSDLLPRTAAFQESKIRRHKKGTKTSGKVRAGRFAPKGATATSSSDDKIEVEGYESQEEFDKALKDWEAKQAGEQNPFEKEMLGQEAAAPTAPPAAGAEKGEMATRILGDFKDTQALYTDGKGRYTPDRLALHDEIIDRFLEESGEVAQEKPVSLFMAGGTAAGKTTILPEFDDEVPNAVIINPDEIKAMLPEYTAMLGADDQYAAMGTHEESSDIAKKLLETANEKKYNSVIDGTGDSEVGKFEGKVKAAEALGRKAKVVLVDIPTDLAVERSMERAKVTGRMVPEPEIRKIHATVARRHADWVEDISEWEAWANEGEPPKKIAERKGGVVKIHDRARYQALISKGKDVPGEDEE